MIDKKVDWILPMCGEGTRTQFRGPFKPLIQIKGIALFKYFIKNIAPHIKKEDRLILILREDHDQKYSAKNRLENIIKEVLPELKIITLIIKGQTKGPVDTIRYSISKLRKGAIITIINPDQIVDFKWPNQISNNCIFIPIYFNNEGKSSYVIISEKGEIKDIFEKEQKSFYASVGIYIFSSKDLISKGLKILSNKEVFHTNKEQYISHLIKSLIEEKIDCYPLETTMKYDLGNKECIQYFEKRENGII